MAVSSERPREGLYGVGRAPQDHLALKRCREQIQKWQWMSIQATSARREQEIISQPKLLMVCAHRWEAEPFLRLASLKSVTIPYLPVKAFSDERRECWLLLCGQGASRASTATAIALTHLAPCSDTLVVANFGFAAAQSAHHPLQATVLGHRLTDHNSGDSIYPERTLRTPWKEAEIVTVGKPLTNPVCRNSEAVYDMEASSIFSATELFLSTSQMVVGKFISDHLSSDLPDWAELRNQHEQAYSQACAQFYKFALASHQHLEADPRRKAAKTAQHWWTAQAERLSTQLALSVTQTRQMQQTLRALALSNAAEGSLQAVEDEITYLLDEFGELEQKHDRQRALEKVQQLALAPLEFES